MKRFLLLLIALSGPFDLVSAQDRPPATTGVRPGDQLRISVWRKPEMSGDFTILGNGTISHPLYKEVQVAGVPLSIVEDRLRIFLSRYETNPQFVILPLVRILVGGEVRAPDVYTVPMETTIAQAIILGGGPSERANLSRVKLVREGQTIEIDMSEPNSDALALQIRSGDQLFVGRRGARVGELIGPITSSVAAVAAIVSIFAR